MDASGVGGEAPTVSDMSDAAPKPVTLPHWWGAQTLGWRPGRRPTPTWKLIAALVAPSALAGPAILTDHAGLFGALLPVFVAALVVAAASARWDMLGAIAGGLLLFCVVFGVALLLNWQQSHEHRHGQAPPLPAAVAER
jgi:hypothetical protein